MDTIGAIKFRVEKVSSDNRQKNILSLLYIVWFFTWFLILTIVCTNTLANIVTFFLSINSFLESMKNNFNIFDITDVIALIKLIIPMFKLIIPTFVTLLYVKYFEKMKFRTELIYMIINTIITMFLFLDIKKIISLILVIFLLMLIVPISS